MANSSFHVERVREYDPEIAAGIGRLMPDLSERKTAEPVPRQVLDTLIASLDADMFIAYQESEIVGAVTIHKLVGFYDTRAILQSFVTKHTVRGQGAGYALWCELLEWCRQRQIKRLVWMSNPDRTEAHAFYNRQGAQQRDKHVFEVKIDTESPEARKNQ